MSTKSVRWIICGAIPLLLAGLCSCGLSGSGHKVPTITLSANPTSIISGQSATLTWHSTDATLVTITATAGSSAPRTVASSSQADGSVSDSPTQTTTYSAVATGKGGTSKPQTVSVTVNAPAPPQITTFSASPTTVGGGQTTTITWATTDATTVNITPAVTSPDETGPLPLSGNATVPVATTTTFTITASGPGGNAGPQTVTVTVPFTLTLSASPSNITSGQTATLSWQVTNGTATSITVTDPTGAAVCNPCLLPAGTATVTPAGTTTYTATAVANATTNITASATVNVGSGASGVIKHIFFMLQENRSFDNYFGVLGAYRTTRLAPFGGDTQTIDGFDPTVTLTNSHTGAKVTPFHENTVCTDNLTPSWDESHHDVSLSGGDGAWNTTTNYTASSFAMQGFLDTTGSVPQQSDPNGTRAMGYYNQQDLPYYYDLASFFPTSDTWHSPILASTIPNRMYLMAATSFGHEYSDNSGHPAYAAPTIFRAMNTANVSWLYYYVDGIFLANFADFQSDPTIKSKTYPISDLLSRLSGADADKSLPEVIFIESGSGGSHLDEHPLNNIQSGAAFVQSIIQALMNSNAWQDSVFILSFDEGGGTYDHVPPFMVPAPDNYTPGTCPDANNGSLNYCSVGHLGGTFNLSGFRVPLIVISPYAKPDFVSHTPRDYTAILAFIEKTFNIPPLTARDGYWAQNGDMQEFFDFTTPALLTPPASSGASSWPQLLKPQTTGETCSPGAETGP